ncbi:kinase-like domain-containing protein [Pisolithus marmoratus]|nr:kinase-like domain-containing protein [Pisolithus marmoratus]
MISPRETLGQYAERASRYAINLNGQVCKEDNGAALPGGNAIVYPGFLSPHGTRVAIKVPRSAPPNDERVIRRILREVHVWSKLSHENIVLLLGITTEIDQTVSIVSPWMEKGNAFTYVQDTAVDPRPLMIDIARGLEYLHTCVEGPIFHGDLKGPNVLISDSGRALLTDFGFSYHSNSSFSMPISRISGWTVQWTAPEILDGEDGEEKSAAADIWSFGMTLLELFTRKIPFHQVKGRRVALKIVQGITPVRPSVEKETCSRLTDPWWAICLECWKFEPASRPTIAHVLQAVSQAYNDGTFLCVTSQPCGDVVN